MARLIASPVTRVALASMMMVSRVGIRARVGICAAGFGRQGLVSLNFCLGHFRRVGEDGVGFPTEYDGIDLHTVQHRRPVPCDSGHGHGLADLLVRGTV